MFNKYAWKQPIFKSDLMPVITNGLIFGILGGILGGLLDYLFNIMGINISFSLLILSYFIGKKVKESYYSYHILYPTLTILFMLVGLLFTSLSLNLIVFRNFSAITMLFNPKVLLNIFIGPFTSVIFSIISLDLYSILISSFNLIMYVFAFIYAYKLAKGRN